MITNRIPAISWRLWTTQQCLHISGFFSALLYFGLMQYATDIGKPPLVIFLAFNTGLFLLAAWAAYCLYHSTAQNQAFAWRSCIIWALLFRLLGLLTTPIYEDDFYRYLWDGYLFWHATNPFGIAPSAYFNAPDLSAQMTQILNQINYPDVPTLYGPVLQYLFALNHGVFGGQLWGLKLLLIAADLVVIILLTSMAPRYGVLLYAWCPLVIKEVAISAHTDIIGVALLLVSLACLQKHRYHWALIALACSAGAKIFAWLFLPYLLLRCRWWQGSVFVLTLLTLYLPFYLIGNTPLGHTNSDLSGLHIFVEHWQFNSSFYALFSQALAPEHAKALCLCLGAILYSAYLWFSGAFDALCGRSPRPHYFKPPRGDYLFALFFLLSPVVNAWYVLWLLPFAAMQPSYWAWITAYAVLWSYVTGLTLGDPHHAHTLALYQQPLWALGIEYGLITMAVLWDSIRSNTLRIPDTLRMNIRP